MAAAMCSALMGAIQLATLELTPNVALERPRAAANMATRAHNYSLCSRRTRFYVSRPLQAIVRRILDFELTSDTPTTPDALGVRHA